MGNYLLDNGWRQERERLAALESVCDPGTFRLLAAVGVAAGWHCLEVGAGGGSVAAWLAERVGPTGHVLATDIDPRFLEPLAAQYRHLDVRRHDVVEDELPAAAFDLVHARLVLEHLAERERALWRLAAALAPGGWLVVEAVDFASEALDPALDESAVARFARLQSARARLMADRGFDLTFARGLARRFCSLGLTHVESEGRASIHWGGTAGTEVSRLTLEQLSEHFVAGGYLRQDEIGPIAAMFRDPAFAAMSPMVVATWGRRPPD